MGKEIYQPLGENLDIELQAMTCSKVKAMNFLSNGGYASISQCFGE